MTDLRVVFVKVAVRVDGKTTRGHLLFHEPEGPKPMNWAHEQFVKWVYDHFKIRRWHYRQGVMGRTWAEVKGGTVAYRGELHLAPQLQNYETPLWSFENKEEQHEDQ